jgi:hypothetical protein
MPPAISPSDPPETTGPAGLIEVRYSLPALLREIQQERAASSFAMEKLDQTEIGKLFAKKRPRRATAAGK